MEDRFELGEEIMDTIQIKKTTNTYKVSFSLAQIQDFLTGFRSD